MNSSNYRFTLDMHRAKSQISFPVMLGDTNRTLNIILSDGGKPYIIEDGCLAKITIKRPTGTHIEDFCTIVDNTTIVYDFSQNENTAAVAGLHECDITLYDKDGKIITSPEFSMVVSERVLKFDDITLVDEDYTAVDAMIAKEAERQTAEAERISAEAERVANDAERYAIFEQHSRSASESASAAATSASNALTSETNAKASCDSAKADADRAKVDSDKAKASEEEATIRASEAVQSASSAQASAAIAKAVEVNMQSSLSTISRNEKRITNIELGLPSYPFQTDNSVAYSKDVPENALPNAMVSMIGGATRKCANLIPFPYNSGGAGSTTESAGVAYKINADGSITANGTATETTQFGLTKYNPKNIFTAGKRYSISPGTQDSNLTFYVVALDAEGEKKYFTYKNSPFTWEEQYNLYYIYFQGSAGATLNNITFYPMINEGDTALPYEPYFEGLRSAPVTEIESVGANLLNPNDIAKNTGTPSVNGESVTVNGFIADVKFYDLVAGETYHFSAKSTRTGDYGGGVTLLVRDANGEMLVNEYKANVLNPSATAIIPEGAVSLQVCLYGSSANDQTTSATYTEIMLNKGEKALPYAPYREPITMPIPEAVQAIDGYGWGIDASVYNYIDWENMQFVKRVGCVDLGTLDWNIKTDSSSVASYFAATSYIPIALGTMRNSIISNSYRLRDSRNALVDKSISTYNASAEPRLCVADSTYTDAATLKVAMAGVMLYYELATPIITDISDLITVDNYIEVEGNCTVTMVNEHGYAVPSEINYRIKGVTV